MLEKIPNGADEKNNSKNEKMVNIYGKERFSPEFAKEHLELLISDFKNYYTSLGYQEEPPVLITSGIDPTVRFVGSHISVLKPYLIENSIPGKGIFISQNCIRTRNADSLLDDDYSPKLASFFNSLGVLAQPERLPEVCKEVFDFLNSNLGIPSENILIRINSADADLMSACKSCSDKVNIEPDSRESDYYRHKLGMDGVWGRNFNIALRNTESKEFSDIGNVIVIENAEKKLGVEVALGTTIILRQMHGLDHTLDCTPVADLHLDDKKIRRKFEDSVIVSTVLYREGLRPLGQRNQSRILKQYVRSLSYFRAKAGMNIESLSSALAEFESRELPELDNRISDLIVEYVKSYENELKSKKDLTGDDEKIKTALDSII